MKKMIDFDKITRFEVFNKDGREFVSWNCRIIPYIQDNGRTLKIFVEE